MWIKLPALFLESIRSLSDEISAGQPLLLKVEIENFYSIREPQVLDFTVAATAPQSDRFITLSDGQTRVSRVAALFGANASGKTTVLRALSFMRSFAESSFKSNEPDDPITIYPFDCESANKCETILAVEFITFATDLTDVAYRYEIRIGHEGFKNFISAEILTQRPIGKKSQLVFKRTGSKNESDIEASELLPLAVDDPRREVRSNVSLLSALVQFGHKEAKFYVDRIRAAFVSNVRISKTSFSEEYVTSYLSEHRNALDHFNKLVRTIDVGIDRVELLNVDGKDIPVFHHFGLDGVKTLPFESQGTKNFFLMFPNLTYSLTAGTTAVLDEMDSDLHPSLLYEIVRWYRVIGDARNYAQLFISCQHASLLNDLWKEEVFLASKNEAGETSISRLSDLPKLRRDTNLYVKYMSGEFGAVPRFG